MGCPLLTDVLYVFTMAVSVQSEPFVYPFKPHVVRRILPLAYVAFLLACASVAPLQIGVERFFVDDLGWAGCGYLTAAVLVLVALALRVAFPPARTQPRLEIWRDKMRFVPGPIARHIFAEPISEAEIPTQSREILSAAGISMRFPTGILSLFARMMDQSAKSK